MAAEQHPIFKPIDELYPDRMPTPHVIRGHHIEQYHFMFTNYPQTQDGTKLSLDWLVRREVYGYYQSKRFYEEVPQSTEYQYYTDVIGFTEYDHNSWQIRQQELWQQFFALSPTHPIKLGAISDDLCRTCIIGNHCKTSGASYGPEGETRLSRDIKIVNQFIDIADKLDIPTKVIQETTDYYDMPKQDTPAVLTTADAFSSIVMLTYLPQPHKEFQINNEAIEVINSLR